MDKKKKMIRLLAGMTALLLALTNVSTVKAAQILKSSGLRTMETKGKSASARLQKGDEKAAENDRLSLYVNRETLGIKVRDKATGYLWASTLQKENKELNRTWYGMSGSGVTIEYMDEKGKIKKASINNGRASVKLKKLDDGFKSSVNFRKQGIRFDVECRLSDDKLTASIPEKSLKEKDSKNRLTAVYLFPFLGYTEKDRTGGYFFVPDGSGALIRLNEKNSVSTQGYERRVYGEDLGAAGTTDSVKELSALPQISCPVYGMVHGEHENGFAAIIEEGEEYASILANPAGITTEYNWLGAKFLYRESYFKLINKKGDGYDTVSKKANRFTARLSYQFLAEENADYSGMARSYREYLTEEGVLKKQEGKSELPMHLEVLLSERKKALFGTKAEVMTEPKELDEIIGRLDKKGINSLNLTLHGYGKKGSERQTMEHLKFEKKAGSRGEWEEFVERMNEKKIPVSFYTDYVRSFDNAAGFNKGRDTAQSLSGQLLAFRKQEDSYAAPGTGIRFFKDEMKEWKELGTDTLTMGTLGDTLYASHNKKNSQSRSEAKELWQKAISKSGLKVNLYGTNACLWEESQDLYQIDMDSGNYFLFTDQVPFVQMVLKGSKDYYAPELNFSADIKEDLLKMVDFGAYPSFLVTGKDSRKLAGTESEWIYSSSYKSVKGDVEEAYGFLKDGLEAVEGKYMESRRVLAEDVVLVSYEGGTEILVNYSEEPYSYGKEKVPAKSYKVFEEAGR